MEHGVVMSNQELIDLPHLPAFLDRPAALPDTTASPPPADPGIALPAAFNLHAIESRAIQGALKHAGGNRTKAAGLLGISRRTLQRKLKELSDSETQA